MHSSCFCFLFVIIGVMFLEISCQQMTPEPHFWTTESVPAEELDPVAVRASIPSCQPLDPRPPNFAMPGRRISAVKCYEVIWNIRYRKEKEDREAKCLREYNRKTGGFGTAAVGGRNTEDGEFPHMGAIGWRASNGTWIFKCGGSLLSPRFVLTAGHCVRASDRDTTVADPVPRIVRLGDKNILDDYQNGYDPVDANISRIIPHPDYKSPAKYNDIALLELENDVTFTNVVHPGCLWGIHDLSVLGKGATLTGWGVVETASRKTSPELQAADVDFIDQEQCGQLLPSGSVRLWKGLKDHQICAGKLEGGVDACQGDSGGPLQVRLKLPDGVPEAMHYIVGVTSFGIGCALPNTPGIYTRVSSFIDWIESTVWPAQ